MPKVRILLADDHAAVLDHVAGLLAKEKKFKVVAVARDGATVLSEHQRLKPEVIVLDISMGELSGIDVARRLRASGCQARIVFLTVHEDPGYVSAAMGAGGSAYVVKSRVSRDLVAAIHAVLAGKLFVSSTLLYQPA